MLLWKYGKLDELDVTCMYLCTSAGTCADPMDPMYKWIMSS